MSGLPGTERRRPTNRRSVPGNPLISPAWRCQAAGQSIRDHPHFRVSSRQWSAVGCDGPHVAAAVGLSSRWKDAYPAVVTLDCRACVRDRLDALAVRSSLGSNRKNVFAGRIIEVVGLTVLRRIDIEPVVLELGTRIQLSHKFQHGSLPIRTIRYFVRLLVLVDQPEVQLIDHFCKNESDRIANLKHTPLHRYQRNLPLSRLITFRNLAAISSATMTAVCSSCGYRFRSISQYSDRSDNVRLVGWSELDLDLVTPIGVRSLQEQAAVTRECFCAWCRTDLPRRRRG